MLSTYKKNIMTVLEARKNYKIVLKQLRSYVIYNRNYEYLYFAKDSILVSR